jgi:hypothetical protein
MKNLFPLLLVLLFLGCSSDTAFSGRRVTFKANGVYKIYEDITVVRYNDSFDGVPFTRIQVLALPKDGAPESFSVVVNRGGDFDGQSRNGNAFLNGDGYNYNFDHPLVTHILVNTPQKIKGTFDGIYTDSQGQDLIITEGTLDITYYEFE